LVQNDQVVVIGNGFLGTFDNFFLDDGGIVGNFFPFDVFVDTDEQVDRIDFCMWVEHQIENDRFAFWSFFHVVIHFTVVYGFVFGDFDLFLDNWFRFFDRFLRDDLLPVGLVLGQRLPPNLDLV
jgi:hypothetical protein